MTPSLPGNDTCRQPLSLSEGPFDFDNCFAQDHLPLDNYALAADLWYSYTPACNGQATLSGCGNDPLFDTIDLVYRGGTCTDITETQRVAAFDDSTCGGTPSYIFNGTFPVIAGQTYLFRIAGFPQVFGGRYNRGHATLNLSLAPSCPADFNQDGGIDGADVAAFFNAWENGGC